MGRVHLDGARAPPVGRVVVVAGEMGEGPARHDDSEPMIVVSRRTVRRALVALLVVLVLVGVGIGAFFVGRSTAPASSTIPGTTDCQRFSITSTSMYPTLRPGDHVTVCGLSGAATTGEIVVFRRPPLENCGGPVVPDLVKRVIGLPGETIQGKDGAVYIDGKRLAEPWLPAPTNKSSPVTSNFGPLAVPRGDYFVMGDNRTDSCDSRDYGPVPGSYIVGQVPPVDPLYERTTTTAPTTTLAPTTEPPPAALPLVNTPSCGSNHITGVRPTTLIIGCGGSHPDYVTNITWSTWSSTSARGTGTLRVDLCTPVCATGPEGTYPASITLSHPATVGGQPIFGCLAVIAPTRPPSNAAATASSCRPATGTNEGWGSGAAVGFP